MYMDMGMNICVDLDMAMCVGMGMDMRMDMGVYWTFVLDMCIGHVYWTCV